MFIIGVFFFMAATSNTRQHNIDEYNAAVDAWQNTHLPAFKKAEFVLSSSYLSNTDLQLDTSPTDKLKDSDKELRTYDQARFRLSGTAVFQPDTMSAHQQEIQPAEVLFTSRVDDEAESSQLRLGGFNEWENYIYTPVDMNCRVATTGGTTTDSRETCQSACNSKGGAWDSAAQYCYVRSKCSEICVKVSSTDDKFSFDTTGGGNGCFPKYAPATMQPIKATGTYHVDFTSMSTTVRSAYDPYVVAARITDGSFNFGLTTGQKLTYGVGFVAAGSGLMFVMGLVTVYLFKVVFPRDRRGGGYSNVEKQPLYGNQGGQPYYPPQQAYPPQQHGYPAQQPPPGAYNQPPTYGQPPPPAFQR